MFDVRSPNQYQYPFMGRYLILAIDREYVEIVGWVERKRNPTSPKIDCVDVGFRASTQPTISHFSNLQIICRRGFMRSIANTKITTVQTKPSPTINS